MFACQLFAPNTQHSALSTNPVLELLKQPMIQPPPTNHRASQAHESLVDVVTFVEPGAQAAELVQQAQGLFDEVTKDAQAAAVGGVAAGDLGRDAALPQLVAMGVAVVAAVGHQPL